MFFSLLFKKATSPNTIGSNNVFTNHPTFISFKKKKSHVIYFLLICLCKLANAVIFFHHCVFLKTF